MKKFPIAVARGDGIGPEIMQVVLDILDKAGAPIEPHFIEIGEKIYLEGSKTGINDSAWETIKHTSAFLKAPITTPQGGGFKSLNVTVRTTLGLFANVRPSVAYAPFIATKHPNMDVVIVRENEEDLYTGLEYRQTHDAVHAIKIISRPGCERIVQYAFEYALQNNRKKVTCFTKDNILKLSDGLFHKVFEEVGANYPSLEKEHWIVDIGAAKLADTPEVFDVLVLPNLYGDILSDVAAQIAGSVGLAGSANIGKNHAMFEAIHGSAPRRAGQNLANPSGLLLASVQMLAHLGLADAATHIHNAWLVTIEEGIHTYDIFKEGISKKKVGTKEFGQAVIQNLGKIPSTLKAVRYQPYVHKELLLKEPEEKKEILGVDISIQWRKDVEELAKTLQKIMGNEEWKLESIGNRGSMVWPSLLEEALCIDTWNCRFMNKNEKPTSHEFIFKLLQNISKAGLDFTKIELLVSFNGQPAFHGIHGI